MTDYRVKILQSTMYSTERDRNRRIDRQSQIDRWIGGRTLIEEVLTEALTERKDWERDWTIAAEKVIRQQVEVANG